MNLRKEILDEYGYQRGCPGCEGMLARRAKIPSHLDSCRARIVQKMSLDDAGRQRLERDRVRLQGAPGERDEAGVEQPQPRDGDGVPIRTREPEGRPSTDDTEMEKRHEGDGVEGEPERKKRREDDTSAWSNDGERFAPGQRAIMTGLT